MLFVARSYSAGAVSTGSVISSFFSEESSLEAEPVPVDSVDSSLTGEAEGAELAPVLAPQQGLFGGSLQPTTAIKPANRQSDKYFITWYAPRIKLTPDYIIKLI